MESVDLVGGVLFASVYWPEGPPAVPEATIEVLDRDLAVAGHQPVAEPTRANLADHQVRVLVGREPREGFPFGDERGLAKTIGNYWPYATTLYDYTNRAMPFDRPGTLTPDQVYAVSAYVLHLNGLIAEDEPMNAKTLPQVEMPNREGFVPDDRPDSKQ